MNILLDTPIIMYRGDSVHIPLYVNCGDVLDKKQLVLTENMFIYVGIMSPNQKFEDAIIKKKYSKEDMSYKVNGVVTKFSSIPEYSATKKYSLYSLCKDNNNVVYYSLIGKNIGNDLTDTSSWREVEPEYNVVFNPRDTENLCSGKYYIEIKLLDITNTEEEVITTILPKKLFYILD